MFYSIFSCVLNYAIAVSCNVQTSKDKSVWSYYFEVLDHLFGKYAKFYEKL